MSNKSFRVSARSFGGSRWSIATRCLTSPVGVRKSPSSASYDPSIRNCSVRNGCVVPPLRRLISSHMASYRRFFAHDEVDRESASTPSRANRFHDRSSRVIAAAYPWRPR